jgi:nitroimidazol reductase NimA-like FMN-containing flavoprotein (pyridoxamine 5'-phosphate oxidase superfamily)
MSALSHKPETGSNLVMLSEAQCFELLAVATVGRVGFVSPGGLQIIPVNYRLGAHQRIFMRVAPNGLIAHLAELHNYVAFEVDYHAEDFRVAWSVLMQGSVSLLDAKGRSEYTDLHLLPTPSPGRAGSLPVQFIPTAVSGRSLQRASP